MGKKAWLSAGGGLAILAAAGLVRLNLSDVQIASGTDTASNGGQIVGGCGSSATSTNTSTSTTRNEFTTHNTTIVVSQDNFAESGALPINLGAGAVEVDSRGNVVAKRALPQEEIEKLGKELRIGKNQGITFLNGLLGVGVPQITRSDDGSDYATVSVKRLKPDSFNIKAGWYQDFVTPYGKYSLTIVAVNSHTQDITLSLSELP
jgi:hypothetical protein